MAGQDATIGTLRIAFAADAPDGRLASSIALELAGLEIPSLPPTLAPWVPRRIVLHPVLSGVGMAELTGIALAATAPRPDGGEGCRAGRPVRRPGCHPRHRSADDRIGGRPARRLR